MDKGATGFVGLKQLRWLLADHFGLETSETRLLEMCLGMNFNPQAQLDYKEFVTALLDILIYAAPNLAASKKNDALSRFDKYLESGFPPDRHKARQLVEQLCRKYDLESDGRIALAELLRVLRCDLVEEHALRLAFPLKRRRPSSSYCLPAFGLWARATPATMPLERSCITTRCWMRSSVGSTAMKLSVVSEKEDWSRRSAGGSGSVSARRSATAVEPKKRACWSRSLRSCTSWTATRRLPCRCSSSNASLTSTFARRMSTCCRECSRYRKTPATSTRENETRCATTCSSS